MAPTIEEYERLLGLSLTESPHYFHQAQPPSWTTIARLLRVSEAEMEPQMLHPLLYLWLIVHLFHCKSKTTCHIEDFKWSWIKAMTKEQWVRQLGEAFERMICWYPSWNEREQMITKCGGYPNVPLLGTQGAINYNLELASRQAGYPMDCKPTRESTIGRSGMPGLTSSEKGSHGELEVAGSPRVTKPGLNNESTW
ncbi:hypothetical protein CR513_61180, partial [Mucuna pruriens]